jgi:hypothetical protein
LPSSAREITYVALGSLAALTELQRTGNVGAQDIDGGFEFNGRFSNELVYEQMIKKIMANEDAEYRTESLGKLGFTVITIGIYRYQGIRIL